MTRMVLIYDDEPTRVEGWRDRLRAIAQVKQAFEVEGVTDREFTAGFEELKARRKSARNRSSEYSESEVAFDKAAILVIDYDLLRVEHEGYLTGEAVAYLARCYSRCGLIVGLNQFGENPFDLTLRGYPESYADVNLGSKQLDNRGLWTEPWTGFRPWQWPLLPAACQALEDRVSELQTRLDTPIVEHLGLSEGVIRALPRAARDYLAKSETIEQVTFRMFALSSGQGYRTRDNPLKDEQLARVAAARVAQWVESYLLPGQDILVDAPHLVYRFPSLLQGDGGNLEIWNRTTTISDPGGSGLQAEVLGQSTFPLGWVSRPAWYWSGVSTNELIKEVKEPWLIERPSWVFCEDLSQFMPLEAAREFIADVESPFARRYVSNPQSTLVATIRDKLLEVDYRPQERLYL